MIEFVDMSNKNDTICEKRLKNFRESLRLTQEEIALKYGGAKKTISSYETGNREPSTEYILFLASLGLNIHWLYTGQGEMLYSGIYGSKPENLGPELTAKVNEFYKLLGQLETELSQPETEGISDEIRIQLLEILLKDAKLRQKK